MNPPHAYPHRPWSRLAAWGCLALAAIVPVAALVVLAQDWPHGASRGLAALGLPSQAFAGLNPALQAALVALLLVPAVLMGACLWEAAACLRTLGREATLTRATIVRLRRFAAWMLGSVAAGIVIPTVVGVVVSLMGTGKGTLVVGMSSHQAILVVFAAVTWQITRAMESAVAVADEYAQIV